MVAGGFNSSYWASHQQVPAESPREQLIAGLAAMAIGTLVSALIYFHPEGLRAPAWVAHVAALAFVFAGLCLLAAAFRKASLQRWLGIVVTVCLLTVSIWVAFGPGERECSMSLPFVQSIAPDVVCRGAFVVGAILVGLFLVLVLRRTIDHGSEA
jgi:hypothetical protein